jgi:2-keto-4-pentenoate hydratase/2-oxohepta-3-ene-1,7-dioic acid hydratase in catechol pathway
MLHTDGTLRDLSEQIPDLDPERLAPESLTYLRSVDPIRLPIIGGSPRLGMPITGVRKFIAIGLNYRDHAAESNMPIPEEPVVFSKAITCLSGPYDNVLLPRGSQKGDWEVELGCVIGKTARYVDEHDALDYVAGYLLVNDLSEREYQLERGGTWDKGKGCDTFGPIGPWFVSADELGNPQDVNLWLDLNGRRMQNGNTRTMIFGVDALISYLSRFMTLEPGDIVTTGTPPGVGMGQKPKPLYLKAGDMLEAGADKLGTQRQEVKAMQ